MQSLQLTLLYSAVLALLFCGLSLMVVFQRARSDIPYGDGSNPTLRGAIRAHGNFAEYVTFAILLLGFLEITGLSPAAMHGLFIALLLARLSHAIAMFAAVKSRLYFITRIFGAFTTWLVILISALLLLFRSL